MSRYITKVMYLDLSKRPTIWNRGSTIQNQICSQQHHIPHKYLTPFWWHYDKILFSPIDLIACSTVCWCEASPSCNGHFQVLPRSLYCWYKICNKAKFKLAPFCLHFTFRDKAIGCTFLVDEAKLDFRSFYDNLITTLL